MKNLTTPELFSLANISIKNIYQNVLNEEYKNIIEEKHRKIKMYTAIDRTNMFISDLLGVTFYTFNIYNYQKNRKSLIKIIENCENLNYTMVREEWYNRLRDKFYLQKKEKELSEKLERICILVRVEEENGFISISNNKLSIVNNISEASEFAAVSDNDYALDLVREKLYNLDSRLNFKVFFTKKMKGRLQAKI